MRKEYILEARKAFVKTIVELGKENPGQYYNASGISQRIPENEETYGYVGSDNIEELIGGIENGLIETGRVQGSTTRSLHRIYRAKPGFIDRLKKLFE
jgi:hypothetical protein